MSNLSAIEAEEANERFALRMMIGLPIALISAVGLAGGWIVARNGGTYRTTKWVLWPAVFTISNFLAAMIMIPVTAISGMTMGNLSDITLFESVFVRGLIWFWHIFMPTALTHGTLPRWELSMNGTPISAILVYQFFVWFFFSKWIMRNLALAMYDAANVKNAMAEGTDINVYRIEKAKNDPAYLAHAMFYENKGHIPPWSRLSVGIAGGFDCVDYYFGDDAMTEDEKLCAGGFKI